jgi:hypothetical protein
MDETSAIDLTWEGPFSFCSLLTDQKIKARFSNPGIYLWVVDQPSGTKITYLGKASGSPDLVGRHVQHYRYYISGAYSIPAWAMKSNTSWDGDWNSNANVTRTLFDRELLSSFVREAFDYASRIRIYLTLILPNDLPHLALIENALIYGVQPEENMRGKQFKPQPTLTIRNLGAIELVTILQAP